MVVVILFLFEYKNCEGVYNLIVLILVINSEFVKVYVVFLGRLVIFFMFVLVLKLLMGEVVDLLLIGQCVVL